MGFYTDNKRSVLESALAALEKVGSGDPTAYHVEGTNSRGQLTEARPDIQSEARFNSITRRVAVIRDCRAAIREELIYMLSDAETRVD